ncbi:MAG: iron-sulfur cluster assembly scaffold protein [Myxococcales bacterium]|nr:iron-sulfur cluster assembly scaffold protein [Myxococcales bacterium]
MEDERWSKTLLAHFREPRNVGSWPEGARDVGTALVGSPRCGEVMRLQLHIDPHSGVIREARFRTFGSGEAIASSSLTTEWVTGKTIEQALAISNREIAMALELPAEKLHCTVLAEEAIRAAIDDFRTKCESAHPQRTLADKE